MPKLLIAGDPGAIIKGRTLEYCRTWPNQTKVTVKGLHFLQEDSPDEIGRALQAFVKSVRAAARASR
jgi:haloalkane dehalogenase